MGIILAFKLKDNRAFCKYICPITVFLKPMSYFSLSRVRVNEEKCVSCNKCRSVCPMNVDMLNNKRNRKNGTGHSGLRQTEQPTKRKDRPG